MKQTLTPKDVAEALGVSESSLKRWADAGRLQVTRTLGGHRRIEAIEALRFARDSSLPVLRPDLLGLPSPDLDLDERTRTLSPDGQLASVLGRGQSHTVRALIMSWYLQGHTIAWILDGPVRLALRATTSGLEGQQALIQEHRAHDELHQAFSALRSTLQPAPRSGAPARPNALVCAPADNVYTLSSAAAASVLAEAGLHEENLGPHTPLDTLPDAAARLDARLVVVACVYQSPSQDGPEMAALAQQLAASGTTLALLGARTPDLPDDACDTLVLCDTYNDLAELAERVAHPTG